MIAGRINFRILRLIAVPSKLKTPNATRRA
jgi:hypothetical protein